VKKLDVIYFGTLLSETNGVVSTCNVVVTPDGVSAGITICGGIGITVNGIILFSIKYILHNKKI